MERVMVEETTEELHRAEAAAEHAVEEVAEHARQEIDKVLHLHLQSSPFHMYPADDHEKHVQDDYGKYSRFDFRRAFA
jgi:hypothetical protein